MRSEARKDNRPLPELRADISLGESVRTRHVIIGGPPQNRLVLLQKARTQSDERKPSKGPAPR